MGAHASFPPDVALADCVGSGYPLSGGASRKGDEKQSVTRGQRQEKSKNQE